jgi:spermidine/putrescine ABC transporter ATP-binding subunit
VTPAVEISGVRKDFGETTALAEVDLAIADGEFVSLLGASGCGKSTLLRIISGFETPSAGRVRIHGEDVTGSPPDRRPTNIVFQRGALFPHMNVFDNVAYSLRVKGWARERIAARVGEMLALVRLEGLGRRMPHELSGGQAQRVALARALAAEPKVLLLDEPLSALDLKLRQQMQLELRTIQRSLGATFVFVTHDQTEALVMSDRIAIMERGRIVQVGTPREVYMRPASVFVSDFIGQTNLLRGNVLSVDGAVARLDVGGDDRVLATAEGTLAAGAPATLSVRPEAIRIVAAAAPGASSVAATIREIVYLGASLRLGAVTARGDLLWADLRDEEAAGLSVGTPVTLTWPPSAALAWQGGAP